MSNPYLIVPIVAWVVGQVCKFCFYALQGNFNKKYLYSSGGLPSTHSAIVGALAVTALIEGGVNSPGFGISAILLLIVMIDAVNVRRAVGENRQALRTLYRLVPLARQRTKDDDVLDGSAALGHTPAEVVVGAALGAITAYGLLYSRAVNNGWGLQSQISNAEELYYYVIFGAMLLVGLVLLVVSSRGESRRLPTGRALRMSFRHAFIYPAIFGFGVMWADAQGIQVLSRHWLVWAPLVVSFSLLVVYSVRLYDGLRDRFSADIDDRRMKKTLKRSRSKRRKRS